MVTRTGPETTTCSNSISMYLTRSCGVQRMRRIDTSQWTTSGMQYQEVQGTSYKHEYRTVRTEMNLSDRLARRMVSGTVSICTVRRKIN